jgi:hypothetical protein
MLFERKRFEAVLASQRTCFPVEDKTPVPEMSDDAMIAEVDYNFGKAWAKHHLK